MTESTHGIILRTRPLTETSLIVQWLTPDLGRLSTVAKGARRTKSLFHGKLDLFYAADFSFARSQRSELHTLREASLKETHAAIREDILKLQQASYAAAFIEQATESESPILEIFDLMRDFLKHLCEHPAEPRTIFAMEFKLLRELGLEPDAEEMRLTPGSRKMAEALLNGDWQSTLRLKLSDAQSGELRQFLHGFLIFHLGRLPRGRASAVGGAH